MEVAKIKKYAEQLKDEYKYQKEHVSKYRWPHFIPAQFTNLGYIILDHERTKNEANHLAELKRLGSYTSPSKHASETFDDNDDEYDSNVSIKEEISDIFIHAKNSKKNLQIILAEGAPGIGKSMLLKEIAYLWAVGELLEDKEIVLLISLRDPNISNINSPKDMFLLCDFCKNEGNAQSCTNYFFAKKGEGLVILFDGLDENEKAMQEGTFWYKLITNGHFSKACVIVTSRPHATLHMQEHVSFRVVIIGFTIQRRREFVKKNLEPDDAVALEEYLKTHPVIDTLCHIPLNLSILVSLKKHRLANMPQTQTDLIKTAVEMTITHNLHRMGDECIQNVSIEQLPEPYKEIFYKLCTLAYKALVDQKFTFTTKEIRTACTINFKSDKKIDDAIKNGLGLIQAAQFVTKHVHDAENTISNFVHFSVQELLTAWYISFWHKNLFNFLPFKNYIRECMYFCIQQRELKDKFWKGKYMDMWSLYIGLTEAKDPAFKHFLTGNRLCCVGCTRSKEFSISQTILDKKIYALILYMCLQEAPNNELIEHLGKVIGDNCLDLSKEKITQTDVDPLSKILSRPYLTMQWKSVNLAYCDIDDEKFTTLEAILSLNDGRPKANISALTLRGNGLQSCGESIARLVQNQKVIHLDLSRNTIKNFSDFKSCVLLETIDVSNNNLNEEALELFGALKYLKRLNTLKLNNNDISDDEHIVDAIGSGLCYCTSLKKLELEGNMIEDTANVMFETIDVIRNCTSHRIYFRMTDKAIAFIRILRYSCQIDSYTVTLKENLFQITAVNLSRNGLQNSDAKKLGKCLHLLKSLELLDISENKISNASVKELTKGIILVSKLRQFKYTECQFSEKNKDVFNMVFYVRYLSSNTLSCVPSKFHALVFILQRISDISEDLVWSSDIVKTLGCVTELDLSFGGSGDKLNDENIMSLYPLLSWLRQLETLCLKNNNITVEATEPLVLSMLQIHTFKQLEIVGNPIVDSKVGMIIFTTIRELHERKLLSFTCNQDSDHVICQAILYIMECLSKIRNAQNCELLKNVVDLIVHSSNCESSYKLTNYINFLPGLRCLDVSGATITKCGMEELSAFLMTNHQLERLDLSSNDLRSLQVQTTPDSKKFKIVKCNNCNVTNKVLSNLAQLLMFNDLDVLELEENCFDNQGIKVFYNVLTQNRSEPCTTIISLNLSKNNLGSSSAEHIVEIIAACKTTGLNVSNNNLDKLFACFELVQITTLKELDISSNNQQTNAEFTQHMKYLKNCNSLEKLNISNNCIDKDAVDHLYSYFISCAGLELICDNNPATTEIKVAFHLVKNLHGHQECVQSIHLKGYPAASQAFVSAFSSGNEGLHETFATRLEFHTTHVKQIDLSSANLQISESFVSLLKKFTNLQVLNLSDNNITDESFKHVAAGYLYTSQLKSSDLHLSGNPCASNNSSNLILEMIEDIRSASTDFVCLPANFNAFLSVLELVDKVDSEQSDVCRVIFSIKNLILSYSEIAGSFSSSISKQDSSKFVKLSSFSPSAVKQDSAARFVKLSSNDAVRFCHFLKHFKSLEIINLVENNITEDAKDSLVTSILKKKVLLKFN